MIMLFTKMEANELVEWEVEVVFIRSRSFKWYHTEKAKVKQIETSRRKDATNQASPPHTPENALPVSLTSSYNLRCAGAPKYGLLSSPVGIDIQSLVIATG